ncbi:MAG: tetratricopeptide repeat protein [Desulfobacteraceae bacterium]|nr:tetratricopeptide repeat protein [Desulfobacteraceae bacterium]
MEDRRDNDNIAPKKKKPLKDIDSAERTFFLRILLVFLRWGLLGLPLFIYWWGWLGALFWLLCCLTLAIIVEFSTDRLGHFAGIIYRGSNHTWTLREQFQGTLDIVRVLKRNRQFDAAMVKLEEILAKDPCFAEALFLKAQILVEGYGDTIQARRHLKLVLDATKDDDAVHRWALTLQEQLARGARPPDREGKWKTPD